MNYICDLDPNIYRAVVKEIATSSVIITDRQIEHIRERHPDISGTIIAQLSKIILEPDYIIDTDMPYTANILKQLEINGKGYQLVLRIRSILLHLSGRSPCQYRRRVVATKFTTSNTNLILCLF